MLLVKKYYNASERKEEGATFEVPSILIYEKAFFSFSI